MPRTLAQNAQYIAETIKPAIKSAIEAQGVTVPSTDSFLDYADRIAEIEGGGSGYQLKDLPSGAISTVNDAAELPLNALKVSVEAVQDLHGYDHPWAGGAGKNKLPLTVDGIKSFNTSAMGYRWKGNSCSVFGITFELLTDDGNNIIGIKATGTASNNATLHAYGANISTASAITYDNAMICTMGLSGSPSTYRGVIWKTVPEFLDDQPVPMTAGDTLYGFGIRVISGYAIPSSGIIFKPMVRLATESDATFAPYSNICPISGWDSGEITVCDDIQNPTQTETYTLNFPTTIYGGEWDVVNGGMDEGYGFIEYDGTEEGWLAASIGDTSQRYYIAKPSDASQESTADGYSASSSSALTATGNTGTWGSIVVGGEYFRFRDGGATHQFASLNDFKTWLAQQAANGTPVQIKYPLATPTTIPLSPLSIRLLEGVNNIYADCGDIIDGEYFVDEGAIDVRKVDYSIGPNAQPMIADGRYLSGFASMSGYGAFPRDGSGNWLDVDWSDDFEIGARFKASTFPSSGNMTIFGSGIQNSMVYAPDVYFWNGSTAYITLSTDGSTSAVDTALNYTFQADTWYFVRLKFTLSTLNLKIEVSTDMENFTTAYNGTLASVPYHNSASICIGGMAQSSNYASNSIQIDTFNTYIKDSTGSIVWGAFGGA